MRDKREHHSQQHKAADSRNHSKNDSDHRSDNQIGDRREIAERIEASNEVSEHRYPKPLAVPAAVLAALSRGKRVGECAADVVLGAGSDGMSKWTKNRFAASIGPRTP